VRQIGLKVIIISQNIISSSSGYHSAQVMPPARDTIRGEVIEEKGWEGVAERVIIPPPI
jgi:hypothetical protein